MEIILIDRVTPMGAVARCYEDEPDCIHCEPHNYNDGPCDRHGCQALTPMMNLKDWLREINYTSMFLLRTQRRPSFVGIRFDHPDDFIAICPVCGEPVQSDTLVAFCGHDDSRLRKCVA